MSEGVNFTVKAEGASAVGRALVGLQLRMRDLRPVLAEIGAALLTSVQRRFEDEQGPSGAPWAPIQRAGAILRDSGRLFQSLTYAVAATFVEIGTNVIYGRIHQEGGWAGRGHSVFLEARPYLGLDEPDRREMLDITNDYIREVLP